MEHVAEAVPHFDVGSTFALLHDFIECGKRRRQVADGDDASTPGVAQSGSCLPGGIAAEYAGFAEVCAQVAESLPDRLVELANRFVGIAFGQAAGCRRLL